ncbi:MAG: S41 family peptidase [Bryobacteraceae bacterium]
MSKRLQMLIVSGSTCLLAVLILGTLMGRGAAADGDAYKHFTVLSDVIAKIKSDYVEEPNMHNVTLGALNGLLESIDPFASYLSADQYKQYSKNMSEKKADVGLVLSRRSGYIGIVDAIPGSPAAKLGLQTFDIIEAIGGVGTRDMPLAYAEMLLRGEPGSSLELSVIRVRKSSEAQKVALTREMLTPPAVHGKMLADSIGYVRVQSLEKGKSKDIAAKVKELEQQGAKKLILDMRDNASGDVTEGLAVADLFLDSGQIGFLQGQKVTKETFSAKPDDTVSKAQMVVITNRGTACGAEVAVAGLLDNKRADVVGERTYGCGAVRKPLTLEDGSAVILAVAKYHSPSGKALQDNGVVPQIQVVDPDGANDDEEESAQPQKPQAAPKTDEDLQLKKAIEVLQVGLKAAKESAAASSGSAGHASAPQGPLNVPRPQK